jgi:hypothetical protein
MQFGRRRLRVETRPCPTIEAPSPDLLNGLATWLRKSSVLNPSVELDPKTARLVAEVLEAHARHLRVA